MAKTFEFTQLDLTPLIGNLSTILNPDSEALVYTRLGVNVSARKYDSDGDATSDDADTGALLIGYNTTTVPPGALLPLLGSVPLLDVLVKNGESDNDSLRATGGNDIVYWDYATLFSLLISVPVGLAVAGRFNLPAGSQEAAIEVFDLGEGRDILNLTHSNQEFLISGILTDAAAYAYSATAYGGGGDDVLWSAAQSDTLYGGDGNDRVDGGAGDDTIYGGLGFDILEGGAGNDLIFDDLNSSVIRAGSGNDMVELVFTDASLVMGPSSTDGGGGPDGNDSVFIGGSYSSTNFDLGDGQDKFVASDVDNAGTLGSRTDIVRGGGGNDAASAWYGNDTLYGDTADTAALSGGSDVLWGGAGSDTIYGGPGTDYLYGGAGNGDVIMGGAGVDYYYWSRTDGNDLIDDNDPGVLPGTGAYINAIIVFPDFDGTETIAGSDSLRSGTGVFETDHNLYDNAGDDDMVQLVDIGSGMMELRILAGAGAGSVLTFEQNDISNIALWNNDAAPGTQVIQQYVWNEAAQQYLYAG